MTRLNFPQILQIAPLSNQHGLLLPLHTWKMQLSVVKSRDIPLCTWVCLCLYL